MKSFSRFARLFLGTHLSALWIAANPCASCHPKQVAGYQKTGMANSLSRAANQPSGSFRHAISDTAFEIRTTPKGQIHTIEREGVRGSLPVAYVIGSGNHAFGYLVNVKGYLFQSPISYYSKRRIWDMAPGYEGDRNPDFTRPVAAECLWCHSGRPLPKAGNLNRYGDPPFAEEAISCDRCHGATEAHLRNPSASNIVNPARLSHRARDSVCEQCHLNGEARIPNPGKQIGDYKPGLTLEEVFSVYVFEAPVDTGLKVISHVQQMGKSMCRIKSGERLWCGTCHDPHNKPSDPVAYYRSRCLECHESIQTTHAAPAENCVGCHMPTRQARDGGHTAFTDHEIQREPTRTSPPAPRTQKLVPWQPALSQFATRNLGLANVAVGERDRSSFHLDEGFRLLSGARVLHPNDASVLTSLGLVALRQRKGAEAVSLFEAALAAEPAYAPYFVNLATALKEVGQAALAIEKLNKAMTLDPSLEPAYRKLAEIMREARQPRKLTEVFEQYLRFMPENVSARIALQAQ